MSTIDVTGTSTEGNTARYRSRTEVLTPDVYGLTFSDPGRETVHPVGPLMSGAHVGEVGVHGAPMMCGV